MSNINNLINHFSIENLTQFFRNIIPSFSPDEDEMDYLFEDDIYEKYESILKIGEAEIDNDDLIIIASKTHEALTERSGKKRQYDIAKKILKEEMKDAAFFVFYDDEGNFRFSFIKANYLGTRRDFTDFKRLTYFVSPEQTNRTFINQVSGCSFDTLEAIEEAFSVEPLNIQFYKDIAQSFYRLIGGRVKVGSKTEQFETTLELPSTPIETHRKTYQEFGVRLIGRTIFCWFLKNKKSPEGIALVPESWLSSKAVKDAEQNNSNYYHQVLEKLFFLVLNKKIDERQDYDLPDGHKQIPFLNGGLFEVQHDDFFPTNPRGIHQTSYNLKIDNEWFDTLFETLEQYNFTIDENSVYDSEVSIDPEMLGTIFENLLAEIDPDTEKSARKATGSFYTPRPIVDYMVEQSLVQYLKTKTQIEDEDSLMELFKEGGNNQFDKEETGTILNALNEVKILDPACGSGAFPMGALHKIIHALEKLDPDAEWWKELQLKNIPNVLARKILQKKLEGKNADYIRKLGVLQNSIYGVDIQPIATEISKLRSFLSLVIDETIDDNADNRGIQALPNLEFKFVTANTLIGLEEKEHDVFDFGETAELQKDLIAIRNQYLQAYGDEKEELKVEFNQVQDRIYKNESKSGAHNTRAQQLIEWYPFENKSNKWFDPYWMFGVKEFDVVIGNPPYSVFQGKNKKELEGIMTNNIYKKAQGGKINAYELFLCKIPELLKNDGVNCQIFQNSFLADNAAKGLRRFYLSNQTILSIDSFPERDNPKKRIFKSVKMSVCILLNKNTHSTSYDFTVNFWEDRYKQNGKHIIYNNNSILSFSKEAIIYNLNNQEKIIFEKYYLDNKTTYLDYYRCLEGELNMTFHKEYLTTNTSLPLVVKGAQVQRYYITKTPSQGIIEYVEKKRYLLDYKRSKKSLHHKQKRIAMQGITGANDKIRIVATLIDENIFLANSCNYIIPTSDNLNYNIYTLLGIFNSKFTNWIFRRSSTNSNVNCYEVNSLKLPSLNKKYFQKISDLTQLCIDQNKHSLLYEELIDTIVYKLYELTYEEVKLIDPEFSLSQEEYDNFEIA